MRACERSTGFRPAHESCAVPLRQDSAPAHHMKGKGRRGLGCRLMSHPTTSYLASWLRYMARMRLAPYVPVPQTVGDHMLALAQLKPGEVVADLGCGDGRLLRQAVYDFGAARAVGYELDYELVDTARRLNGDDERIIVRHEDALQSGDDLREADVVALYLTERGNASLLPLLAASLKPSSRVVSYCWGMDGLPPTRASTCRGKDVVLTIGKPNVMLWEQSCIVRALRTPAG